MPSIARLPGAARLLAVVALVDAVGTGLFLAVSVVFFTRTIALSGAEVGAGLSLGAVLGLAGSVPFGVLSDRYGARRVLIALNITRFVCFAGYAAIREPWQFWLVVAIAGIPNQAVTPLNQAIVGSVVDGAERVRTMAVLRVARNVGFAAGSLLAAAALATANPLASRALIAVDALTFLYAAAAMRAPGLRAAGRPVPPAGVDGPRRQPATTALRDRRYLFATLLNGVLSVHMTLLAVGIPVWVVTHTRAPAALVGMLLGINTVLAMLLQVPASRYATSLAAAARSLAASGALLALACTLLAAAARVPPAWAVAVLVTAVLAHTAAELLQSAGGWTLSYELAPGARQSTYLSVFNLGVSVQRAAGPALVTGIVIAHGTAGWLGLAALLCLTALSGIGQGMWRGSPGLTPAPRRPAHRREKARHRRPPQPAASRRTRVPGRPSRTARAELRTASPPGA